MKKYSFLIFSLIGLCLFSISCQEYNQEQQQLWDQVMEVHDEIMPKMGDLHQLKKQLKKREKQSAITAAIASIEQSQDAMMDWMREFKSMRDLSKLEHQAALNYLKKEQERVEQLKQLMLGSLEEGKALLQ